MSTLKDLHMERMKRLEGKGVAQLKQEVTEQVEVKQLEETKKFECIICYGDGLNVENLAGQIITRCGHNMCAPCYTKILVMHGEDTTCPMCRAKIYEYEETKEPDVEAGPLSQEEETAQDALEYAARILNSIRSYEFNLTTPPRINRTSRYYNGSSPLMEILDSSLEGIYQRVQEHR
jgi:hypothetical protein